MGIYSTAKLKQHFVSWRLCVDNERYDETIFATDGCGRRTDFSGFGALCPDCTGPGLWDADRRGRREESCGSRCGRGTEEQLHDGDLGGGYGGQPGLLRKDGWDANG